MGLPCFIMFQRHLKEMRTKTPESTNWWQRDWVQLLNTWRIYSRLTNFIDQSESHELGCSTFLVLPFFVSREYWVLFVTRDHCLNLIFFLALSSRFFLFVSSDNEFWFTVAMPLIETSKRQERDKTRVRLVRADEVPLKNKWFLLVW